MRYPPIPISLLNAQASIDKPEEDPVPEVPNVIVWVVAAGMLVAIDRVFRTGGILTAIGVACLGGVFAALLSSLGFAFESAVVVVFSCPLIYGAALKHKVESSEETPTSREENVGRLVSVLPRLTTWLDAIVINVALVVLVLGLLVAIASEGRPKNEIFGGLSMACGVLVSAHFKRRNASRRVVAISGVSAFFVGGLVLVALIAVARFFVHGSG